jgi:hypothetical protein
MMTIRYRQESLVYMFTPPTGNKKHPAPTLVAASKPQVLGPLPWVVILRPLSCIYDVAEENQTTPNVQGESWSYKLIML